MRALHQLGELRSQKFTILAFNSIYLYFSTGYYVNIVLNGKELHRATGFLLDDTLDVNNNGSEVSERLLLRTRALP